MGSHVDLPTAYDPDLSPFPVPELEESEGPMINLGALRHPLHHAKYMVATLVINTALFPVEHWIWERWIGWMP